MVRCGVEYLSNTSPVRSTRDQLQIPPFLVGFVGPSRSGKDTASAVFAQVFAEAGQRTRRVAFADPVWAAVRGAIGDDLPPGAEHSDAKDQPILVNGLRPRDFAIAIGQGVRQRCGPCTWIELWHGEVAQAYLRNETVLTPDARTADECRAIRDGGGVLIALERRGVDPSTDAVLDPGFRGLAHHYLANDGDLVAFEEKCRALAFSLLGGPVARP